MANKATAETGNAKYQGNVLSAFETGTFQCTGKNVTSTSIQMQAGT